jgi:hypothetical protein
VIGSGLPRPSPLLQLTCDVPRREPRRTNLLHRTRIQPRRLPQKTLGSAKLRDEAGRALTPNVKSTSSVPDVPFTP